MNVRKLTPAMLCCKTAQKEFFISDGRCVAVRTQHCGTWLEDHFAIDEAVSLTVRARDESGRAVLHDLWVHTFGHRIRTSAVHLVETAAADLAARAWHQLAARFHGGVNDAA